MSWLGIFDPRLIFQPQRPPCLACGRPYLRTAHACPDCATPRGRSQPPAGALLVRTYAGRHPDQAYAQDARRLAALGWTVMPGSQTYGGERGVGLAQTALVGYARASRAPKQLSVTYTHD